MTEVQPEFGTYTLPEDRESLRRRAGNFSASRPGRWMISWLRKRALKNIEDPFDIEIKPGLFARVWPRSNRCEKRVFAGHQIWDTLEHMAIRDALEASVGNQEFVFLDVGANVGFYSLFLAHEAKLQNRKIKILAVEPDPTNRARLMTNIAINSANIDVAKVAISDKSGTVHLGGGQTNRGEVRIDETASKGDLVEVMTLSQLCDAQNISRIDAMKLDIEGQDQRALTLFFAKAPKPLWPKLLILETGRDLTTPLLELCTAHGYEIQKRSGINSILKAKSI